MDEPICMSCRTDDYLRYEKFQPAREEPYEIATWQGSVKRVRHVPAVVEFTCVKCGSFNGHSVPDGWSVPSPNPRVLPEKQTGVFYG